MLFNTEVLKSGDNVNRYIRLFCIELCMVIAIIFNSFVLNIFEKNIYVDIFWLAMLILTIVLIGFEKDKHLNKSDTMQTIFIVSIFYMILTYICGFFLGYVRTIYNLKFPVILYNSVPILIMIILQELLRYDIVTKMKKSKLDYLFIAFLILIFVVYDFIIGIGSLSNIKTVGIFETIGLYILPSLAKNLLLTYMAYNSGYKTTILYRLIFDLTLYLLPIFPDFGVYIQSILNILFPTVMFFILNKSFAKREKLVIRQNKAMQRIGLFLTVVVFGTLIILVSGLFKYYILTVGSGSMEPNLNIGDVVIIKKLDKSELSTLKKGDILVFSNNKVVIHRIYEIFKDGNKYSFQTKGDNNNDVDGYIVYADQVIGVAKFKIPWIGKPTVWLSQLKD